MLRLRQARDTPQLCWHALAEMCLWAIGQSENPPKYRVAIHCIIVLECHSNARRLPTPMRNMPAAIWEPSTLLKHPVKCISPQGFLVQFVSPQVVSHSRLLILTTSLSSRALLFGSSGVPHPVEHLGLQSAWHASNYSQRNTVHRPRAFPSLSHSLDFQVHLTTAALSDNTSQRVNGIPALQWIEVWIQFSHLSQFSSPCYFSSGTDETHQQPQNSTHSVTVGHCSMVSLWMLRYHTTQGGYSIGFPAHQDWCWDPRVWDSHFWRATSWRV